MKSKISSMQTFSLFFLIVIGLSSCTPSADSGTYMVVLRTDENGNALLGSKEELIEQVRAGADIKVGWGAKGKTRSIEHLSEPIWIAIRNEEEISVLLDPHVTTSDSSQINQEWRVTMSTTGEFDAVWYDKFTGRVVRHVPQRHPMVWYAKAGSTYDKPLYLEH